MLKARPRWREVLDSLAPLLSLVVLSTILSVRTPTFGTTENIKAIGLQTAVIAIIALGETLVIVAGGIDLSVGSVVGLAGVCAGWTMAAGHGAGVGLAAALLAGSLCGLLNGVITVKGGVPPFIVTLGMLGVARGAVLVITGGSVLQTLAAGFRFLGGERLAGIPVPIFVVAGLAAVLWVMLERMRFGRYVRALGGNHEAARLSGVAVDRHLIQVFTLSGLCSGLAGAVLLSRVAVAAPMAGEGYELDAVAAAVIGGASFAGGEGGVPGTLIGALLMGVLKNGCNLLNVSDGWQRVTIGLLIVGAVFYDHLRRRARGS